MQKYKAFTVQCNTIAEALWTKCGVCKAITFAELNNGKPRPNIIEYDAVWDTGATRSSISKKVVDELGLEIVGYGTNHTAGGTVNVNMHKVNIVLPCETVVSSLLVSCSDLDGPDVLIGMDVITQGDFSVTNVGRHTTFSFRIPSLETIDYDNNHSTPTRPIPKNKQSGRNDPCPCGSGKKFKDCHGKGVV